jgi:hypothetical protein
MNESYEPQLDARVQYGYFVVQAKACRGPGGLAVTGVLENLGTGEKATFESSEALGRLLEAWSGASVTEIGRAERPRN